MLWMKVNLVKYATKSKQTVQTNRSEASFEFSVSWTCVAQVSFCFSWLNL